MQSDLLADNHFVRALSQLGEKRRVVASGPIVNAQGLKLIDKGVAIDARLYDKLTRHQLRPRLDESVESEHAVDGAGVREAAEKLCAEDRFCAAMVAQLRDSQSLFDELALMPMPGPVAIRLTVMRDVRPDLWQHSLRSMVCAGWLAARLGGSRYDMRMLAAGGLVHDLGMLHLDPVLCAPDVKLEREQRRQLYTHPLLAVMILDRHHAYPKEVLQAVLEHHEALDGSGYPRHLGATQSAWGRLLALSELVSSLTAAAHPAPARRLSVALRMNASRYDPQARDIVAAWLQPLREALPEHPGPTEAPEDLRRIAGLLQGWQAAATPAANDAGAARAAASQTIAELCDARHRAQADCGATPDQLALLGSDAQDPDVLNELALIAREGAWQLRTVTRQARRRWQLRPGEDYPPSVQAWLDEAEAVSAATLGR